MLSGLSGGDAKAQAESALDDLAASYKQALAPIDCGWRRRRDGAGRHAEEMAAQVKLPSRQLLVFGFGADAAFEGQLVGALERVESGGAVRILEVVFVAADEASGRPRGD